MREREGDGETRCAVSTFEVGDGGAGRARRGTAARAASESGPRRRKKKRRRSGKHARTRRVAAARSCEREGEVNEAVRRKTPHNTTTHTRRKKEKKEPPRTYSPTTRHAAPPPPSFFCCFPFIFLHAASAAGSAPLPTAPCTPFAHHSQLSSQVDAAAGSAGRRATTHTRQERPKKKCRASRRRQDHTRARKKTKGKPQDTQESSQMHTQRRKESIYAHTYTQGAKPAPRTTKIAWQGSARPSAGAGDACSVPARTVSNTGKRE